MKKVKEIQETLQTRFWSKTPKIIRKLQLMLVVFAGGGATLVTTCNYIKNFKVPEFINHFTVYSCFGSTILLGLLQFFTEKEIKNE
jgi:hypothetical protein